MSEHQHLWTLVFHLDGCHFYQSSYRCDCGATRVTSDERDIKGDVYSMVWMDGGADCERCAELLDGALPKHSDEIEVPR